MRHMCQVTKEYAKQVVEKLYSSKDFAKAMGWYASQVSMFKNEGKLPEPLVEIAGKPFWWVEDVLAYKADYIQKKDKQHKARMDKLKGK